MKESQIKNGMIVRIGSIPSFIGNDYSEKFIGKIARILNSKYCGACKLRHYDILIENGEKSVDEFDSKNFIKANRW